MSAEKVFFLPRCRKIGQFVLCNFAEVTKTWDKFRQQFLSAPKLREICDSVTFWPVIGTSQTAKPKNKKKSLTRKQLTNILLSFIVILNYCDPFIWFRKHSRSFIKFREESLWMSRGCRRVKSRDQILITRYCCVWRRVNRNNYFGWKDMIASVFKRLCRCFWTTTTT